MSCPKQLHGIRVLDLSRVLAGPWCSQMLADYGADVVKVERPGNGDDTRAWGPPWWGAREDRQSAYYLSTNRGKRSIAIDLADSAGAEMVRPMAAHADVVIENYKVGQLAKFGLDYPRLAALNPRLVYCSITGYGQDGPYAQAAGYDFAIQATGGLMRITGEKDGTPGNQPQKVGVAVADIFTGVYACTAILAALVECARTGRGRWIDAALLDTQVEWTALLEPQTIPRAPILEIPDVFRHPQVVARGIQIDNAGMPMVGTPMRFDGERPTADLQPPRLDEQGEAIRAALARGEGWPSMSRPG